MARARARARARAKAKAKARVRARTRARARARARGKAKARARARVRARARPDLLRQLGRHLALAHLPQRLVLRDEAAEGLVGRLLEPLAAQLALQRVVKLLHDAVAHQHECSVGQQRCDLGKVTLPVGPRGSENRRPWARGRAPPQPTFGIQAVGALVSGPAERPGDTREGLRSGGWPRGVLRAGAL